MKREKPVRELLEIGGFGILMMVIMFVISPIFVPKWIDETYQHVTQTVRGFYAERKDSLDVVFIGDSNIYNGVSPQELWGDYGVASYDFAVPAACSWTDYYYLEEVLKSQHPKLVVLDANSLTCEATRGEHRKALDNLPLSANKIRMMSDRNYELSINGRIGAVFQVIPFHSRFVELNSDDLRYAFGYEQNHMKGYNMTTRVLPYEGGDYMVDGGEVYELPGVAVEYVDKMIERLKASNIEVLLVSIPSTKAWSLAKSNAVKNYAESYQIAYVDLNLMQSELGLDWATDTFDYGEHMNLSGAQKVTRYLGKYLHQNFDLPDRRKNENYEDWTKSHEVYLAEKEVL